MNKLVYVLPVLFLLVSLLFFIPPQNMQINISRTEIESWLDIEKPNNLDVIFPGQSIKFSLKNNSEEELCYSKYSMWSTKSEFDFRVGCYDFDYGRFGPCNEESDMEITKDSIVFINDVNISFITKDDFLNGVVSNPKILNSSWLPLFYEIFYDFTENRSLFFYVTMPHNNFNIWIDNHKKIVYKKQQPPNKWECLDSGPLVINSDYMDNGVNSVAFRSPSGGYNTYFLFKSDEPYSVIHNPNNIDIVFSEEKTTIINITLYDYFFIKTEYIDVIDGVWYRCDDSPWKNHIINKKYTEIPIKHDICDGDGKHVFSFVIEYSGHNTTERLYSIAKSTKKPTIENVSIKLDTTNAYNLHVNANYNSPNNINEIPNLLTYPVFWYKNNQLITGALGKTLSVSKFPIKNGDVIKVVYYPTDFTGFEGNPVSSEPFIITDLPPLAKGIDIYPDVIYPDSEVTASVQYFGFNDEGDSKYQWFLNEKMVGEEISIKFKSLNHGDNITFEYIPVDSNGLVGYPINKTKQIIINDYYYIAWAIEQYNISLCEKINNIKDADLCRRGVETGLMKCENRPNREKFFCLAFLERDSVYCNYIDIEWYRNSCLVFVSGSQEECLSLNGDDRDSCIIGFASSTGDQEICNEMNDADMKTLCIAIAKHDIKICNSIKKPEIKEICIKDSFYK